MFEEGAISVITLIEALRGAPEGKREGVKSLLEDSFRILSLDNNVIPRATPYRSTGRQGRASRLARTCRRPRH